MMEWSIFILMTMLCQICRLFYTMSYRPNTNYKTYYNTYIHCCNTHKQNFYEVKKSHLQRLKTIVVIVSLFELGSFLVIGAWHKPYIKQSVVVTNYTVGTY